MADFNKIIENEKKSIPDILGNLEELSPEIMQFTNQELKDKRSRVEEQGSTSGGASSISSGVKTMNADKHYDNEQEEILANLPHIIKNFYREDLEVASLSADDVARWRRVNNDLQVKRIEDKKTGLEAIPNPVLTFEQVFKNYPEILLQIKNLQLLQPSPLQSQAWPILLKGEDLIGIAQNNTTVKDVPILAYLLPALIHIQGQPNLKEKREGPSVLILTPIKEFGLKIEMEIIKYQYSGIKAVCLYESDDRNDQTNFLCKEVDIVVATPGLINDVKLNLTNVSYIVLDEVDRMLDVGFGPHIRKALSDVRPDRQTIMTTTSWSLDVQGLVKSYMKNPFQINIKSFDIAPVHTVTHKILFMNDEDKVQDLIEFIKNINVEEKVVIYCGEKATATHIITQLGLMNIDCQFFHGDNQSGNSTALEESVTKNILVTIDELSKGINIRNLSHIVNYDFPRHVEDYLDRVLKIGRAGKPGVSLTFLTLKELTAARDLVNILKDFNKEGSGDLAVMAQRIEQIKKREKLGRERRGMGIGNRSRQLKRQRK